MRTQPIPQVSGKVAKGFEAVARVFAQQLGEVGDGGAAFAVMHEGDLVVDLWAGRAGIGPWQRDTRAVLMSTSKGVVAVAVARLVDRDLIDVNTPMAHYWPEFGANGKAEVTVAQVLSHSAGLISIPGYEEILGQNGEGWADTDEIVRRLAAAKPEWPPGTAHAYHGFTYGWLVGELVRRVTGVSVGTIIREEIAGPLDLELDLGTPPAKQSVVAPVTTALPFKSAIAAQLANPASSRMLLVIDGKAPVTDPDVFFNDSHHLAMELPACNATGTARAVATLYGVLAEDRHQQGRQLLSPSTIALFGSEHRRGLDRIGDMETAWGLGFQKPVSGQNLGLLLRLPHDDAFGHGGSGGQIGFADLRCRIGVGFVRSQIAADSSLGSTLVSTTYECLSTA